MLFRSIGPVHRLHHVNWRGEGNVNFGLFLTVWDRLLGTYRTVKQAPRPAAGDIGIEDTPRFPQRYVAQLVRPFMRAKPKPDQPGQLQAAE